MDKQPKKSDRFEINGVEYQFTGKCEFTYKIVYEKPEKPKPVPARPEYNSILNNIVLTKSSGHNVMIPTVRIVDGPKGFYKLTPLGAAHLNPNKAEEN